MTKKWTEREALTGGTVEPDSLTDEFRAQQSSITTLDREQLPDAFVDTTRLTPYALHRVYYAAREPSATGQQNSVTTTSVTSQMWEDSITPQNMSNSWKDAVSPQTFSDFAGGHLYIEWSGIGYVFPVFAKTTYTKYPQNPKYLNLRILVNGGTLSEARGPAYHESFRVFGGQPYPSGDLTVQFQYRLTQVGPDDPLVVDTGEELMQAHLYGMKYLAVGRFR